MFYLIEQPIVILYLPKRHYTMKMIPTGVLRVKQKYDANLLCMIKKNVSAGISTLVW